MIDVALVTDACSDLPYDFLIENNIEYVGTTCRINNTEYKDEFGKNLSYKDFYKLLREGHLPSTSQPDPEAFYKLFSKLIKEKKKILYICVSTGLSGTLNSANIAKQMILEEDKTVTIEIIDSLNASLGQGLVACYAKDLLSIETDFELLVKKLRCKIEHLNAIITVEDLNYLKRGGRITGARATIGALLHIKPVLAIDSNGKVISYASRIKGRKKSIDKLIETVIEKIDLNDKKYVAIAHGDCIEDAYILRDRLESELNLSNIMLNYIGPSVGSYGGPGALAIFFFGEKLKGEFH